MKATVSGPLVQINDKHVRIVKGADLKVGYVLPGGTIKAIVANPTLANPTVRNAPIIVEMFGRNFFRVLPDESVVVLAVLNEDVLEGLREES